MSRPNEFSARTQREALSRQGHRCASCGTRIVALGEAGRADHQYGEGAQAHHIEHIKFGGTDLAENCVVLCWPCHYSAHEGGNYRHGTVVGRKRDYPYFRKLSVGST